MLRWVRGFVRPVVLLMLSVGCSCAARSQAVAPDTSVAAALQNLASRSGVAFVGDVMAIHRLGGVVDVDFRVEQTLLGRAGASYALREWGGLWAAGQHRYWLGERVAIFLHAPGKAGLSSPVDGMEGILPVVQVSADSQPLLDVRRLAARVLRPRGAPIAEAANGAMTLADVATVVANWRGPILHEPIRYPLPIGIVLPAGVEPGPSPVLRPVERGPELLPVIGPEAQGLELQSLDPQSLEPLDASAGSVR